MAGVAADVLNDPALLKAAKDEFAAFRAKNPFANPITDDVEPPLDMAAH
jgi:aminobenzoyl-glutamate utilization protein B